MTFIWLVNVSAWVGAFALGYAVGTRNAWASARALRAEMDERHGFEMNMQRIEYETKRAKERDAQ